MRKLVFGLVVGFLLGMSATGFAAVGDRVEAVFKQFNITIDGEPVTLETIPLLYNGTSYLPVRELANKLGYNVTYIADSETIALMTKGDYEMMQITAETTEEQLRQRLADVERSLAQNEENMRQFRERKQKNIEEGRELPEVTDYERIGEQIMANQRAEIADLKTRLGIKD